MVCYMALCTSWLAVSGGCSQATTTPTPEVATFCSEKYDYKKDWMDQLIKQLKSLSKKNSNIILAGDFNVIPSAEDVYNVKSFEDDALYRLEIRKKFREMLNIGFSDVYRHFNEDKEGYTFWDYMRGAWQKNNGMRIDHFLVSNSIIKCDIAQILFCVVFFSSI